MKNSQNLENLVKAGQLKPEPYESSELQGLFQSGKKRLHDAINIELSLESRFDLAYNSAHALALTALRLQGYRAKNRYIVFQALPFTTELGPEVWQVLAKCHNQRNLAEYEGYLDIDEVLLNDLLSVTQTLYERVKELII